MRLKELKMPLHHMGRGVISMSEFKRGKRKANLVERLNLLTIQINLGTFMDWGFKICRAFWQFFALGSFALKKKKKKTLLKTS
jgi:hypothetical protein